MQHSQTSVRGGHAYERTSLDNSKNVVKLKKILRRTVAMIVLSQRWALHAYSTMPGQRCYHVKCPMPGGFPLVQSPQGRLPCALAKKQSELAFSIITVLLNTLAIRIHIST